MFIALGGSMLLHVLPNKILMLVSQAGFLISVLLFALIPEYDKTANEPSLTFIYWAYVFPAMLCGTIGIDTAYNITNVYITTAMPHRLQGAAGALINSLLYLGMAFWLGVGELAVSTANIYNKGGNLPLDQQYRIGFWTGVGLCGLSTLLILTVRMGKAEAGLTADEKIQRELDAAAAAAARANDANSTASQPRGSFIQQIRSHHSAR